MSMQFVEFILIAFSAVHWFSCGRKEMGLKLMEMITNDTQLFYRVLYFTGGVLLVFGSFHYALFLLLLGLFFHLLYLENSKCLYEMKQEALDKELQSDVKKMLEQRGKEKEGDA